MSEGKAERARCLRRARGAASKTVRAGRRPADARAVPAPGPRRTIMSATEGPRGRARPGPLCTTHSPRPPAPWSAAVSLRRLLRIEWDVIAGIIAALVAMLLSFMGIVSETVGRGIILLLCALLLIRDLRGEAREIRMFDKLDVIKRHVANATAARQTEVQLIGPKKLRQEFAEFATTVYGEVRWFNVCCRMFRRQEIFDATLLRFLENPKVSAVYLMCRPAERPFWFSDLVPKLQKCEHGKKVRPPLWGEIRGSVSFILGDVDGDGRDEALVSVLDEPFSANSHGMQVPRFIFRIFSQCDLMAPLEEVARYATSDFTAESDAPPNAALPHPPASSRPG